MIKNDLQKIKESRFSEAEKIILLSLKELKEYKHKDYPSFIFYKSDEGVFYHYDKSTGLFGFSHDLIYIKLYTYINGYGYICDLIKQIIEPKLNIKITEFSYAPTDYNNYVSKLKLNLPTYVIDESQIEELLDKIQYKIINTLQKEGRSSKSISLSNSVNDTIKQYLIKINK